MTVKAYASPAGAAIMLSAQELELLAAAVRAAIDGDLETDLSFAELDRLTVELQFVRDGAEAGHA